MASTRDVTITTPDLNEIKTCIGYPTITNIELSDDQIKDYAVYPALRSYFTKFPIRVNAQYSISSNNELEQDFPDTNTIGVLHMNVVGKTELAGGSTGFWDIIRFQQMGGGYINGSYGIKGYNPNFLRQTYYDRIQQVASDQNVLSTQDYRIDMENRQVTVNSSTSGYVLVIWAKMSTDFGKVRFERKKDVINLSKYELLMHLAELAKFAREKVPFDVDSLKEDAKEYRDPVIENWKDIPDVIYMRQT